MKTLVRNRDGKGTIETSNPIEVGEACWLLSQAGAIEKERSICLIIHKINNRGWTCHNYGMATGVVSMFFSRGEFSWKDEE